MSEKNTRRTHNFAVKLLGENPDPDFRSIQRSVDSALRIKPTSRKPSGWGQIPPGTKVVRSACFSCNTACEVLVFVDKKTGKILKVEGDPDSTITKGVLCSKGLSSKNLVENPQRLRHPLKRKGERGEGKWESISWDEALTIIADKLLSYKKQYGPQGIALLQGTRRGWSRSYSRLANALGAVNNGAAGWAQCLWPRLVENKVTFGAAYMESSDCDNTSCMLVWGVNPPATWPVKASEIMDARERGARLIVIDPHFSETAAKADLWLQPRPETDTALGLSMLHVIIENDLYDLDFVPNWTTGFEQLKEHVARCTPEWAEKITRVPQELIKKAAKIYANSKPACICRCLAVDLDHDCLQFCRVTSLLAAITGNIDIPGGNILVSSRGEISKNTHDFIGNHFLSQKDVPLRRGYDQYPFLSTDLCPVPTAHMPTLWETVATEEPYPVKAMLIFGSNAAVSYSNSLRVQDAIKNLDFLAVADLFMTETAKLADIVLPTSSWLERDNVISSFQTSYTHTIAQQKAVDLPEARSDVDIIIDLAGKLGVKDKFWDSETAMYDYLLEPTGQGLDEFIANKRLFAPLTYERHKQSGFNTPSGKVELYASVFEENGCDPLPRYTEPFQSPVKTPELAKEFPLIMTSGRRPFFRHTENRQNPVLLELCPQPPVRIHPETAMKAGISHGDPVIIETPTGRCKAIAELTLGLHPDVIHTMPGWPGTENVNNLIPWDEFAQGIGTVSMHSIMCRIEKEVGS